MLYLALSKQEPSLVPRPRDSTPLPPEVVLGGGGGGGVAWEQG